MVKESKVLEYINSVAQLGVSDLQRTFNIGYSDTVKMLDRLELQGVIGRVDDSKPPIYKSKAKRLREIEKYKGKVLPIAGRPGIGQESVALQIALEYTKFTSKSVLIFSPIQPKREIQMRLVSIRDGYNYHWAKSRTLSQQTIEQFYGYVRGMDFSQPSIDDTEDISEEYIINKVSNTDDLGMIVMLDYDFYSEKVSVAFLKMIAEQMQIPIVVDCLVRREVEDRDDCQPHREDMKSSDLAKMDTVLLIYRESYYDLDSTDMTTELMIDRGGKKEIVMLRYVVSRMKFYTIK